MTKADAVKARLHQVFYHVSLRNADGTATRCRVTGACKLWVTRPLEFRLPVKHGLRNSFHICADNAADWQLDEPTGPATEEVW